MILESRSIVFSHDEVLIALKPLMETRGFTGEEILDEIDISLDTDGEVAVTLTFEGDTETARFNSREIGAAVLNHCIEQGIPLPRGSYKELTLRGDMVAMIVRIESGKFTKNAEDAEDAVTV